MAFRWTLLLVAVTGIPAPASAQHDTTAAAREADTVRASLPATSQSAARIREWPVVVLAAASLAALPLDERLATGLGESQVQANDALAALADGFRFYGFPGTILVAGSLYAAGRLQDDRGLAAMGLRGLEAIFLSQGLVLGTKTLFGRERPGSDPGDPFDVQVGRGLRSDRYRSFPSGHTSAAFALAAALTAESRSCCAESTWIIAPVFFASALLAGASRMYEGRHWTSDVLAGAAGGTLVGLRVVAHHRSGSGSALDHWLLPSAIVPAEPGVILVWSFSVHPPR